MNEIDVGYLRECLRYDAETGALTWRVRPLSHFSDERAMKSWNTRYAGSPALSHVRSNGYLAGSIGEVKGVRSHRAIWALVHGYWPKEDIDHINGDRADNRLCNLREASRSLNLLNRRNSPKNTSGVIGVSWCKNRRKWTVRIARDGKYRNLGYFGAFDDAVAARMSANKAMGIDIRET